jgi:hypothetical protein
MEGAWIECPGLSSGSKSLEEPVDSTVCPDFLTGEVSGTFRLSSRSQRPKGNGHPISRSILSFTRQAILSKYQRKKTPTKIRRLSLVSVSSKSVTKPPLHPPQLGWPRILLAIIIAAHTDTPIPIHPLLTKGVILILGSHALVAFSRP